MSIRIITDSASDIRPDFREDVTVLPLHIRFGEEEYLDGVNLEHREFYEKLIESDVLPTTSQIAPYNFEQEYKKAILPNPIHWGIPGLTIHCFRNILRTA